MAFVRKRRGSAISELGPALWLLLCLFFFPLLDAIGLGAQYCCCWYLNHYLTTEVSEKNQASWGPAISAYQSTFMTSGFAKFARLAGTPATVTSALNTNPPSVTVTTTVKGTPFIPIPFLGFTQTTFKISQTVPRENTDP